MSDPPFIPYNRPAMGDSEAEAAAAVVRSGWITSGPKVREFEEALAGLVGARHAIAVSSCTAGLEIALAALDIGPGDEVICIPDKNLSLWAARNTRKKVIAWDGKVVEP